MSRGIPFWRRSAVLRVTLVATVVLPWSARAEAQSSSQQIKTGQNVAPVYEGWERNADGSFNLVFGYFNRNWEETLHLPPGPNNNIEPGGPDQGQPTYFHPRRNQFIFRVRVPQDFGKKELVWTLTSNGKTERAYGTLAPDYFIDDIVIMTNLGAGGQGASQRYIVGNKAPTLDVDGDMTRTATVGRPVALSARASDDGIPPAKPLPPTGVGQAAGRLAPDVANGLRLSWFVYRGPGQKVSFTPRQIAEWQDIREGSNSPWSPGWGPPPVPPDGKWTAEVVFSEPGTYVLRCQAHDGGLMTWEDVTFVVGP
jgi:hypothetical protein